MGAYIFTSEVPFKVLRITKVPILIDEFYQGIWHNQHCDYVIFPAGIFITYESGEALHQTRIESRRRLSSYRENYSFGSNNIRGLSGDNDSDKNGKENVAIVNLSVGKNDFECWMVKIVLNDLIESMISFQISS